MEEYRAIPTGYMTVGELAKKMGVTVRTLQYYDKEGFFSPSAKSAGGRRLYTHKDLIKTTQKFKGPILIGRIFRYMKHPDRIDLQFNRLTPCTVTRIEPVQIIDLIWL